MGKPGRLRLAQVVGHRAFGHAEGARNLGVGQPALVLESENFSNSSHGNPLGWHAALLEQKGASVPTRLVESPRSAPSPAAANIQFPTMLNGLSGIVNGFPTGPTNRSPSVGNCVQHRRNRVHVPSEMPFSFGRNTHSSKWKSEK